MFKRVVIFFLRLLLLVTLLILLFITAVNYDVFGHINTKEELKNFSNETASVVLSDNNTVIGKYLSQNRTNTSYKELPKHLVNALVATEDSRYFEHSGVDAKSLFRVLLKTILLSNICFCIFLGHSIYFQHFANPCISSILPIHVFPATCVSYFPIYTLCMFY